MLEGERWKVRKEETESVNPFEKLDKKLAGMKGRKGVNTSHLQDGLGAKGKADAILAGGERGAKDMDW